MVQLIDVIGGVRQEQIESSHGHAGMYVLEMSPADDGQADHDGQVADNCRDTEDPEGDVEGWQVGGRGTLLDKLLGALLPLRHGGARFADIALGPRGPAHRNYCQTDKQGDTQPGEAAE